MSRTPFFVPAEKFLYKRANLQFAHGVIREQSIPTHMEKKSIKGTRTEHNLLASFAGESQARNRYTLFAEKAVEEGYEQIAAIFLATAGQELSHAKLFFSLLEGGVVTISAAYPAGVVADTKTNLAEAAAGELEEWSALYEDFAAVAAEEGFPHIAALYNSIITVEKMHEERYRKLHQLMEDGKVFTSDEPVKWYCRNCGYTIEAKSAPRRCPVCGKDQGWFERFPDNY